MTCHAKRCLCQIDGWDYIWQLTVGVGDILACQWCIIHLLW